MIPKSPIYCVFLSILILFSVPVAARSDGESCAIQIGEPRAGEEVPKEVNLRGTATLPPDHHIWIFIRPVKNRTGKSWYPQAEGIVIDPESPEWQGTAWLDPRNRKGDFFDVTAAVVSPVQHDALVQHMAEGSANSYPAIQMPSVVCVAKPITVRRADDSEPGTPN